MLENYSKTIRLTSGKEILLRVPRTSDAQAFSQYISDLVDEDTFISSRKQTVEDEEKYIASMLEKIKKGKRNTYCCNGQRKKSRGY